MGIITLTPTLCPQPRRDSTGLQPRPAEQKSVCYSCPGTVKRNVSFLSPLSFWGTEFGSLHSAPFPE